MIGSRICTMHNPPVRLKSVTGRRQKLGDFALPNGRDTLSLSSVEHYDAAASEVTGSQFYEVRDSAGMLLSEMAVPIRFRLHTKEGFESIAGSEGFTPVALYGDYSYAVFDPHTSPFMIWLLRRA